MNETLQKHAKKVAVSGATGSLGAVVTWALMTFTPLSDHAQTRREIQTLRERVSVLEYAVEHPMPQVAARTNHP